MESILSDVRPFGTTLTGEPVLVVHLRKGALSCEVLTYGATLRSLLVPDRSGTPTDIVLGYDSLREYETQDGYLGATIGRFANRIAKGRFVLDGKTYRVVNNDGKNHLHGGNCGFSHRIWTIEAVNSHSVSLSLTSEDSEEGYPGNLNTWVTYTLDDHALTISYKAISDANTICNLTNHSYFNLAGHDSGTVLEHEIMINATHYTPSAADNIPTGTIVPVADTPMDLRSPTRIGCHLADDFTQIKQAGGYDHNFVINGTPGVLRTAATAHNSVSGITMDVETTLPGVQLYTANFLDRRIGKGGCKYGPRHAFCLETQFFPDSPNQAAFPPAFLKANEPYEHTTVFSFSADHPCPEVLL